MIKEALDKRFGTTWHVVVGEGFGFDISYEITRYLFLSKDNKKSYIIFQDILHVLCRKSWCLCLEMFKLLMIKRNDIKKFNVNILIP